MGQPTHDHELKVSGLTPSPLGLDLVRDASGRAMYAVIEEVPPYQNPLWFTQDEWINGHGQGDMGDPMMYAQGQGIDTTQPGRVFLGPLKVEVLESDDTDLDSAPVCFCWFPAASTWYCATSGNVYTYGTKWTAAATALTGVTDLKVFGAFIYAARGAGTLYSYAGSASPLTFTATDLTDGYAKKFLVAPNVSATADVLWKVKTPNEVSSTTDGRTVAAGGVQWTSPVYVGDTSANIVNMFLVADNFMVGREDNLFNYDSNGGLHPLMNWLKHNRSTNNFKYLAEWQGGYYFSLGTGMGEIVGYNSYDPMGPLMDCEDIGKSGTIVGMAADRERLYVAVDEGTNTHIYKGRQTTVNGALKWQWCPWIFLGTRTCQTMAICQHTETDKRLWFGYTAGTGSTGYVTLTDNPTADSNARFDTSNANWVRMSYLYGSNPYWDKMFQTIETQTKGCAASITVTPYYLKDTDSAASTLTAAITTNGIVRTALTNELSGKRFQFQLNFYTANSILTPEVSFFRARGFEKPEVVRIHEATYDIGDTPSRRAKTIRTFLRNARASSSLIRLADLRYEQSTADNPTPVTYVWVTMEPGYPQEIEVEQAKGRAPELGIKVRWREVPIS